MLGSGSLEGSRWSSPASVQLTSSWGRKAAYEHTDRMISNGDDFIKKVKQGHLMEDDGGAPLQRIAGRASLGKT